MHGCSVGACVVARGHVRLLWGGGDGGMCMVARGGMHGCSGGARMVAPGGHAWLLWGGHVWDTTRYGDTANERAVRISLECILVLSKFHSKVI